MPPKPIDTDREERMARGVGMMLSGTPLQEAAAAVTVPRSTLWDRYAKALGPDAPDREKARETVREELLAGAMAVAREGLKGMLGDLEDPELGPGDRRGHTLVASKVMERLGATVADGPQRFADSLARTLDSIATGDSQGLTVEIRPAPRDITPNDS